MSLNPDIKADVVIIGATTTGDVTNIDIDQNTSVSKITTSLSTDVPTISAEMTAEVGKIDLVEESINVDNLSFSTTPIITKAVSASTGSAAGDHAALMHLDYEHSGHTGFASKKDITAEVEITSLDTPLDNNQLYLLTHNFAAHLVYNQERYDLTSRSLNNWSYTHINPQNGAIQILIVDMVSGLLYLDIANPIQENLNNHINNTSVHLQAGERNK